MSTSTLSIHHPEHEVASRLMGGSNGSDSRATSVPSARSGERRHGRIQQGLRPVGDVDSVLRKRDPALRAARFKTGAATRETALRPMASRSRGEGFVFDVEAEADGRGGGHTADASSSACRRLTP